MKNHRLKTDPLPFQASFDGIKMYELRFNDRNFQVGDYVTLLETAHSGEDMKKGAPLEYTERELQGFIAHILEGTFYGLQPGYVILGFAYLW